MIKTIILYGITIVGVPNLIGMLVGTPFMLVLAPIVGRLARNTYPLIISSTLVGVSMGVGCGITGIALTWLLAQDPRIALPLISSIWALLRYFLRRGGSWLRSGDNVEIGFEILGIWGTWAIFWAW